MSTNLPTSPFVLRREAVRSRDEARDIVQEARDQADMILHEAHQQAEQDRVQGHAEGVRDGRAEAARLLAEAAATVDLFYEARERELTDLAFAIAYRIIGEFPANEQLARIAETAIAEHRGGVKLQLRVDPVSAPVLRRAVAQFDHEGRVAIEADENAPAGSCTLVHARGRSAIGLLDQFRAMMKEAKGAR